MGSVGFEATASGGELGPSQVRVRVTLPEDQARELGDELRMGVVVRLVGAWDPYEDDEWGTSMLLRGSAVAVSAKRCAPVGPQGGVVGAVRSLRARLLDSLGPLDTPERALLAGVVLGEQAHLSDCEVYRDFANLGLTHLVAVSGSHLSVVAGLFGVLLTRLRLRPLARFAASAATLAAYVVISGLQPSAERSLVMVLVALAGGLGGRRSHAVSSLGIAALVILLVEPSNVFALGFSLSVLSVLGIVCFSRLAEEWVGAVLGPLARFPSLTSALALTLVAQAFTMPLTLPTFGVLPVLSPLANVLVGPLMSALLLVGLMCVPLSALVPGAAGVALMPCDCLAWCTCRLTSVLATVPHAAMAVSVSGVACAVGLAAGCAFLYLLWPRPSRRAAAVALSCCTVVCVATYLSWRLLAPARVVVLDVGQGDAILVQDGARALLVDTGPNDAVLEALTRNHVMHLDAVLVTHTDSDHAGGLDDLVGLVPVDRVILATGVSEHLRRTGDELLETDRRPVRREGPRGGCRRQAACRWLYARRHRARVRGGGRGQRGLRRQRGALRGNGRISQGGGLAASRDGSRCCSPATPSRRSPRRLRARGSWVTSTSSRSGTTVGPLDHDRTARDDRPRACRRERGGGEQVRPSHAGVRGRGALLRRVPSVHDRVRRHNPAPG